MFKAWRPTAFVPETILNESRPPALVALCRLLPQCIHEYRRGGRRLAVPKSIGRVYPSRLWHFASEKGFARDSVLGLGARPLPLVLQVLSIRRNRFAFVCEES